MSADARCPACLKPAPKQALENHFDRIGQKPYEVLRCPRCGVVFSEPQAAVGAEWYEKAAPIRDREMHLAPERDWRYRTFLRRNLPPGRILDVGCGDGGFLLLSEKNGFRGTGFDYDSRMIELARRAGLADVEAAEFEQFCAKRRPGEFDFIPLFDVLEHTPKPHWFLESLKNLLKPGGYVAITLPNGQRPLLFGREEHDYPPHHFTRWSPAALSRFVENLDFQVIYVHASRLKLSYLSDNAFFYFFQKVLPWAKRRLLGLGPEKSQKTITEIMLCSSQEMPGWFLRLIGDKLARQTWVNRAKGIFKVLFFPGAAGLWLFYKLRGRQCGDCLFVLARRRPPGHSRKDI